MRPYRMRPATENIATAEITANTEDIRVDSFRDSMARRRIVTQ